MDYKNNMIMNEENERDYDDIYFWYFVSQIHSSWNRLQNLIVK